MIMSVPSTGQRRCVWAASTKKAGCGNRKGAAEAQTGEASSPKAQDPADPEDG